MITKFSESIRRNQKQWMVVVTILAVFAFVFDDVVRGQRNSPFGSILMIGGLCAAGMAIVGYPRRKTIEFGLAGLVVGGFVSYISSSAAQPPAGVRTKIGNFTNDDLSAMADRRQRAHRFLNAAVAKVDDKGRAPSFGGTDVGSLVTFAVLRSEANRLGVSISDEGVSEFINKATQDKLSPGDFRKCLSEAKVQEADLYEILREELSVQLLAQLTSAPADAQPLYAWRLAAQTPEQLWQTFRKMKVKQQLSILALPVSDFTSLVAEPSETELKEFFDRHKNSYGDDQGNPGFLVPPKVQLAYLAASATDSKKLEDIEKQAASISEQEVINYYNKNKEQYRILDLPEPTGGAHPELNANPTSIDDAPADATKTENVSTSPQSDGPALDSTPSSESDNKKENVEKKEKEEEKASPETPCDENDKQSVTDKESSPSEKGEQKSNAEPGKDESSESKEAKDSDSDAKQPSSENKEKSDTKVSAEEAAKESSKPSIQLDSLPMPPPAPRYRELDDDLKEQIREAIMRDRAFAAMGEIADGAEEFMMTLSLKYNDAEKKDREKLASSFSEELKAYAAKNGMEYKETAPMTQMELLSSLDEKIGSATDPKSSGGSFQSGSRSVAEDVFELSGRGRDYQLSLYSPRRADSLSLTRYAYWKIKEIPAQTADLKDEEVRKKVIAAWKTDKGRELAKKRAKELVDLVKQNSTDLPAALAGQTINGTADSPAISIRESKRFSWMRTPESLQQFNMNPRPELSEIDGVEGASGLFMKTVFEDLGEGDVGIAVNYQQSVVYVVRVHDRDGSGSMAEGVVSIEDLQKQFSREQFSGFLPTSYQYVAAESQNMVDNRWRSNFMKQFAIVFSDSGAESDE